MMRRKIVPLLLLALLVSVGANVYLYRKASAVSAPDAVEQFVTDEPSQAADNLLVDNRAKRGPVLARTKGVPEQMLYRKHYTVSYNKDTRNPNYVAWTLTADHADGPVKRLGNAWHEDDEVPEPRATNADYKDSKWSRGHMCPAGDNKWDRQAMYDTFCFTNMCPQDRSVNAGVWNDIEMSCRQWAKNFGSVDIVCGPIFRKGKAPATIGDNHVAVPDAFFKVVACTEGTPKGIGFICPNANDGSRKADCVVTIEEVEKATGFVFFPQLDRRQANLVKTQANLNDWRKRR